MKRHVPVAFIRTLKNWYDNVLICVRWNNVVSSFFRVTCGVRQGGILSPMLFIVYVDDMLIKLSKHGCSMFGHPLGALMYADDLVLLAPTIHELQKALKLCAVEMEEIGFKINYSKSVGLRIGKNADTSCCAIKMNNEIIPWEREARYLGMYVMAATRFRCNFDKAKAKFYRTSNAILSKLGSQRNPYVALHLIATTAVPILTYGLEALQLNKTEMASIEHPWSRTFMKMFWTFDIKIVKQCQMYGGFLPIEYRNDMQQINFRNHFQHSGNRILQSFALRTVPFEISEIAKKYLTANVEQSMFVSQFSKIISKCFNDDVTLV